MLSIAGFLLSWVATTLIYFQFGWATAYQLVGVICVAIQSCPLPLISTR